MLKMLGIDFLGNLYSWLLLCQTKDWVFCPKSGITGGVIKSTYVCHSPVQVQKGCANCPRDARSNSGTVRQEINRGCECLDAQETRCHFSPALLLYNTDPDSTNPPRLRRRAGVGLRQTWDISPRDTRPIPWWGFFNNLCQFEIPYLPIQMA